MNDTIEKNVRHGSSREDENDEHAVAEVMVSDLLYTEKHSKPVQEIDCRSGQNTVVADRKDSNRMKNKGAKKKGLSQQNEQSGSVAHHISKSKAMRAVVASKSDELMHPIIRMGWKPLCEVVCNGIQGVFWGGHDRDVYIQCTSPPYSGRPLVEIGYGGCMMTCSHFERISGRELSKKWKESIHVIRQEPGDGSEEGKGSPTMKLTMLKWLKEKADSDVYGQNIVGKKIWVCWCADSRYYPGTVIEYKKSTGKHVVSYAAGVTEELHLPIENIDFGASEPQVSCMVSMDGFNQIASGKQESLQQIKQIVPNPIWNQNSDVSLNIALEELQQTPSPYAAAMCGAVRARAQLMQSEEDSSQMPRSPPPKRTMSPSEALLQKITEACIGESDDIDNPSIPKISPPPAESDPDFESTSLKWMHHLALELEHDILDAFVSMNSHMDSGRSRSVHPASEFQVMLALATPSQRRGIFIALTESYSFHTSSMTQDECRKKIAHLVALCILRQ
jgi:hypothetical protein